MQNQPNKFITEGHRISDQYPVAIKQVPRSRISSLIQVGDRKIPTEFFMHLKAAKCDGVVKVRLTVMKLL